MCSSVLPEMKKWLAAGAKSCNLGESSTSLELVTRERIESVSKHFFTEIWGLGEGSRPRGAPSYEYKKRVEARDALVKAFLEQYDMAKALIGDSGIEIKSRMKMQVHGWWNSSEQAVSLRKDNKWGADGTVAVSGRRKPCLPAGGCAAPKHDQQTPQECADVDEETVKYGYKDPSLDLLRQSYLHLWDKTGDHIGWRNWSAHSDKCRDAGIDSLPERTFYRWLGIEKTAHGKPKAGDEQLDVLHQPIRHQSQISGFLERVHADRVQAQNTIQKTEPVLTDKNGCPFLFSPEWYPELMKMCNDSLDLLGFGPELVLAFATSIYGRKMELSHEEASMYTPSIQWAYWFMRTKLSLRLRKIVGAPVPPEVSQI